MSSYLKSEEDQKTEMITCMLGCIRESLFALGKFQPEPDWNFSEYLN